MKQNPTLRDVAPELFKKKFGKKTGKTNTTSAAHADSVNHPTHYNIGKIEVIEFIEDQQFCYHLGNAVKYLCRAGKKDPTRTAEDLEKAVWYIRRKLETLKDWPVRPNQMPQERFG